MTNKTIIDGIDVSKCEFAEMFDGKCICNCIMATDCKRTPKRVINTCCKENQFCDFKELAKAKDKIDYMEEDIKIVENARNDLELEVKCKEQEYERLKRDYFKQNKWLQERKQENDDLQNKLQAKEQECEKLIKEKSEIKKYLGISDKTIIQRLEELQEFKDELKISEYNYKQALDDIEKYCTYMNTFNECNKTNMGLKVDVVLDLINKAKEE